MLIHSALKLDKRDLRDPSIVPDQIRTWLCLLHSTQLFVTFLTGSVFIIHTPEKRPTIRLLKCTNDLLGTRPELQLELELELELELQPREYRVE